MITPLMYILSGFDEQGHYGKPIDISYLNSKDADTIRAEVVRIGRLLNNEEKVSLVEENGRMDIVDDVQYLGGRVVNISPLTAMLLTKVKEAMTSMSKVLEALEKVYEVDELSDNAVVLRIEGYPYYVYRFVYQTMQLPVLSFQEKVKRIYNVLRTIEDNLSVEERLNVLDNKSMARLELHSKASYWERVLVSEYVEIYGRVPVIEERNEEEKFQRMRKELREFGVSGFVNPLKMHMDFASARIRRKSGLNVSQEVVDYLTRVVKSGGVDIV